VAVIVGSLRKASLNRKMAHALAGLAPDGVKLEIVEIGDLPFYNEEIEATPPESWVKFRDAIKAADAVLFLTPEYNRGVPGVLKNAIDVGSRPYGQAVWTGKPTAVISVSPGALGAFGANHHLRQILVGVSAPVMAGPEAYIGGAGGLFGDDGSIVVEGTRDFLTKFMAAFADWIGKHAA
jgi:chromate reductase